MYTLGRENKNHTSCTQAIVAGILGRGDYFFGCLTWILRHLTILFSSLEVI